ncbi:MAG: DPP IV N-terminal domain-containing protein, partial [Balneolaceae bacterium]|nr:DPP IV N-terminal domain-containing protein [Balneolaceae bacterium]
MMRSWLLSLLFLFIPISLFGQNGLDTLSLKSIFYEPLLAGNRPDFVRFSPDMKHVYYQANDSAMTDEELFRVNLKGNNMEVAPESFERGYSVSPNGKHLVYTDQSDIWLSDLNFKNKRKLIQSDKREYNPTWGPESRRIAFVQDGNIWIINIENAMLTQVTDKKEEE